MFMITRIRPCEQRKQWNNLANAFTDIQGTTQRRPRDVDNVTSYVPFSLLLRRVIIAGTESHKETDSPARGTCPDSVRLSRLVQTAKTGTTRDAAENCTAEFLQCTERNGDHGPSRVGRGESSSLTETVTKTFVNPVYEDDNRDESENEENTNVVQSEIVADIKRFRSHRYFHFER